MDLREAITGAARWQEAYPVIVEAAQEVLKGWNTQADDAMSTNELIDHLFSAAKIFSDEKKYYRRVYNALTAATKTDKDGTPRRLALYHHRVSQQDPWQVGKTRSVFVWHVPSIGLQIAALEAKNHHLQQQINTNNMELEELRNG
jgi:hypothetical protein